MDGTREHHVKQNKRGSKRQNLHVFPHMWKQVRKKEREKRGRTKEGERGERERKKGRKEEREKRLYCISGSVC
jgi:hypothetical protein